MFYTVLRTRWQATASVYSDDRPLLEQLWAELEQAYSATSRHYHTLAHLEAMLRLAEQYAADITAGAALSLAIFYHDAVYKATRSDNEEKSALIAQDRLQQLSVPAYERALVTEMILATKRHQFHQNPDVNLLLDFDLAILGASWDRYLLYSGQIRKEYSFYPDFLYHSGRKKVLRHFLEQESIFKTNHFKQQLEQSARSNLAQELQLLTGS
ncbi:HD domain-containing protein [Rufibacter immobilis]|uniref:HD domain-containing protein n=1 Tax=Rufibacter immobilis TaxID=1348778 RepID=UPI0035EB9754